MRDIEFSAELVAAMLEGLQNQKKIISTLYERYDDEFVQAQFIIPRFADLLEFCEDLFGGDLAGSEFRRVSLFYSLFVAGYDVLYGMKSDEKVKRVTITARGLERAKQSLADLDSALSLDDVPKVYQDFYNATKQSTDKIQQRKIRHDHLKRILKSIRE